MLPVVRGGLYVLVALIGSLLPAPTVAACTRTAYHRYLTGCPFDWQAEYLRSSLLSNTNFGAESKMSRKQV